MAAPNPFGSSTDDDRWSSLQDHREEITRSQDQPTMLQSAVSSIPMPESDDKTSEQNPATELQDPPPTPSVMSIEDWLNKLRSSDRAFYNIMAMEVWSLAKSMDSIVPGFWSQFMENRRSAMQEFVERRRKDETASPPTDDPPD